MSRQFAYSKAISKWVILERGVKQGHAVVTVVHAASKHKGKLLIGQSEPDERFQKVDLTAEEELLIKKLDENRSIKIV